MSKQKNTSANTAVEVNPTPSQAVKEAIENATQNIGTGVIPPVILSDEEVEKAKLAEAIAFANADRKKQRLLSFVSEYVEDEEKALLLVATTDNTVIHSALMLMEQMPSLSFDTALEASAQQAGVVLKKFANVLKENAHAELEKADKELILNLRTYSALIAWQKAHAKAGNGGAVTIKIRFAENAILVGEDGTESLDFQRADIVARAKFSDESDDSGSRRVSVVYTVKNEAGEVVSEGEGINKTCKKLNAPSKYSRVNGEAWLTKNKYTFEAHEVEKAQDAEADAEEDADAEETTEETEE